MNDVSAQDPGPIGVSPVMWSQITAGLLQRVRLLEAMARCVYDPVAHAASRYLPSALTQGHGAYLPQLHGLNPASGRWLGLMTFDIAPDAQGVWWVLGQCSRAALPPEHLAPPPLLTEWLRRWHDHWAASHPDAATLTHDLACDWVVLLPQRPTDPHGTAPLSASISVSAHRTAHDGERWGLPTARADELQVRDRRLWRQTADGPQAVHGVINLQGHDMLDPVEQPGDPHLGVAGLFDVLRQGQVMLLNAPGLVFLDTPAWLGHLPALSQALLGEPLQLPSVTSWWCGESGVPHLAMQRGQDHWIVPTYPDDGLRPHFAPQSVDALSDVQRSAWAQRMRQDGAAYTVQARWRGATPWRVLTLIHPDGSGAALSLGPAPSGQPHANWG